jgi:hypothetical protein
MISCIRSRTNVIVNVIRSVSYWILIEFYILYRYGSFIILLLFGQSSQLMNLLVPRQPLARLIIYLPRGYVLIQEMSVTQFLWLLIVSAKEYLETW